MWSIGRTGMRTMVRVGGWLWAVVSAVGGTQDVLATVTLVVKAIAAWAAGDGVDSVRDVLAWSAGLFSL